MKKLPLFLIALLLASVSSAISQQQMVLVDGFGNLESTDGSKLRDVIEVNRTPLFDNAPFLRLRKGDRLLQAREVVDPRAKPVSNPGAVGYYLLSGGKYYRLWLGEENGGLQLHSPEYCLLCDWEVTMANAAALRSLFREYIGAHTLTIQQYGAVVAALRPEFPSVQFRYPLPQYDLSQELKPDHIVSISRTTFAEFQGVAFDDFRNCFYRYWIRIGPSVCSVMGELLAQGPRHVEREEFEGYHPVLAVSNDHAPYDVDPQTAKIKKAEYDEMIRFQKLVTDTIRTNAPKPD